MKPHIIVLMLLLIASSSSVNSQTFTEKAKEDELSYMQDEEPAMRKAFLTARATLDDFLSKLKNPPSGTSSYAVKGAFGVRSCNPAPITIIGLGGWMMFIKFLHDYKTCFAPRRAQSQRIAPHGQGRDGSWGGMQQ